ncbi:hypothetical protein BJ138DRAFT_1131217 [Hygrophoropsis aurantiaca]|uniref:Uncharacterized protein n=1 Tax=Hygrophoropsis aurantiaca TaxID=72124 RepID=A0ACB7ZU24_9AGAM|nr:hypothetical protein BJ138DRAFT_1131217 [Hygrophoropsis aurantiaca]
MHRVLLIHEIQLLIFSQILDRQTLSALARTCHALGETALDVLWCDLDCFPRLIQCLPKDLWKSERMSRIHSEYIKLTLCRPISSSDWMIFQKYSRRVRSVRGPNSYKSRKRHITIDDAVLLALCAPSAPIPLLPNLTSLNWHVISDAHLSALHRFAPSSLASLGLRFKGDYGLRSKSFDFNSPIQFPLNQVFPSLKVLSADMGYDSPPSLLQWLQPSIIRLQSLVTIHWKSFLNSLESETIMSLSQLPRLTEATFDIPSNFSRYINTLSSRSPARKLPFSKVRTLSIGYDDPAAVLSFLNHFIFELDTLHISCKDSKPCPIRDLLASLSPSLHNIRSFEIAEVDHDDSMAHWAGCLPLTKHTLGPLLHLKELQELSITIQCSIVLNDADLLEMAGAWPNITTLRLNGHPEPMSQVTPYVLVAFLDRCPKLETLTIQVDFSAIDHADFDPSSFVDLVGSRHARNRRDLRRLNFGLYNIVCPGAIAKFLACFLPDQARLWMHWGRESGDKWDATMDILRTIRSTYIEGPGFGE